MITRWLCHLDGVHHLRMMSCTVNSNGSECTPPRPWWCHSRESLTVTTSGRADAPLGLEQWSQTWHLNALAFQLWLMELWEITWRKLAVALTNKKCNGFCCSSLSQISNPSHQMWVGVQKLSMAKVQHAPAWMIEENSAVAAWKSHFPFCQGSKSSLSCHGHLCWGRSQWLFPFCCWKTHSLWVCKGFWLKHLFQFIFCDGFRKNKSIFSVGNRVADLIDCCFALLPCLNAIKRASMLCWETIQNDAFGTGQTLLHDQLFWLAAAMFRWQQSLHNEEQFQKACFWMTVNAWQIQFTVAGHVFDGTACSFNSLTHFIFIQEQTSKTNSMLRWNAKKHSRTILEATIGIFLNSFPCIWRRKNRSEKSLRKKAMLLQKMQHMEPFACHWDAQN